MLRAFSGNFTFNCQETIMAYIYGAPFTLKGTKVLLQNSHMPLLIKGQNHGTPHYSILLEVKNESLTR